MCLVHVCLDTCELFTSKLFFVFTNVDMFGVSDELDATSLRLFHSSLLIFTVISCLQ